MKVKSKAHAHHLLTHTQTYTHSHVMYTRTHVSLPAPIFDVFSDFIMFCLFCSGFWFCDFGPDHRCMIYVSRFCFLGSIILQGEGIVAMFPALSIAHCVNVLTSGGQGKNLNKSMLLWPKTWEQHNRTWALRNKWGLWSSTAHLRGHCWSWCRTASCNLSYWPKIL